MITNQVSSTRLFYLFLFGEKHTNYRVSQIEVDSIPQKQVPEETL